MTRREDGNLDRQAPVPPVGGGLVRNLHKGRQAGSEILIRAIVPTDEAMLAEFHCHLSADSVYSRYFEFLKLDQRIAHKRLARQCLNEKHRATALVAEQLTTSTGNREIVGVVRLSILPEADTAEFALVVGDPWQRQGIGTALLSALLQLARDEGIKKVSGDVLPDNYPMKHLACRAGFHILYDGDRRSSKMEIVL